MTTAIANFSDLSLSSELQKSLADMGYTTPSAIQAGAIPVLLTGKDLIGQAQTGTGKTAAFAIPTIERINAAQRQPQLVVLCPTRELAVQVAEAYKKLLKHKPEVTVVAIYGGEPIVKQFRALRKNPQIIVGTPGRMLDHMNRGSISLKTVKTIVLDEADEMLDMGFRDSIEEILNDIPQPRQTVFFSATMPMGIRQLMASYQNNPQQVTVAEEAHVSNLIEQLYVEVNQRRKLEALTYLLELHQLKLSLVFCNTKRQVDELVKKLQTQGHSAEGLHGGMAQPKRDKVMSRFRKGSVQLLVATDVAARGIDVHDIEAVFNYDLPNDMEYYMHRIGRTGRAGKPGRAFTFIDKTQTHRLRGLRKQPNVSILRQDIPA